MSAPRLQPSRISHSVQSHKHTAEARGVMANLVHQMEQDPSPVTPFTRAGELGVLVQSDSTLTKASPLVEARARSKWFRVWNLSAPPNGAGRFGDAKDSADSRGVLLPGPYPKKGNGQQTPLLPDSMAHHAKMAGFCTCPYPLRSRQMLTQGPSQVASDGDPCELARETPGQCLGPPRSPANPRWGAGRGCRWVCKNGAATMLCLNTRLRRPPWPPPARHNNAFFGIRLALVRTGAPEAGCLQIYPCPHHL